MVLPFDEIKNYQLYLLIKADPLLLAKAVTQ